MMNGGKSIIFSRGIQMTNINGQVNKQEYEAVYDGKIGKMILNDNNKKYYIEADEDDIANLLNKPKSNENLEKKHRFIHYREKAFELIEGMWKRLKS